MCAGSFQTRFSSRWAKLHPQKRSLTPRVSTRFTAKWILRCRSWCWFRQTLHCLMTHKLSLVVKWEAEPGRSQLGKPHAVCPSEQEICAWPCLPLNEWTIVSGVSDMWTVLLLGLCPSRERKQTVSPSDFTTQLLVFPTHLLTRVQNTQYLSTQGARYTQFCKAGCTGSHEDWMCLQWEV